MDNLREIGKTQHLNKSEPLYYCFKSAIIALMRELRIEHVKRYSACDRLFFRNKIESRSLIDELLDQPRGRKPIDMQIPARHPSTALIVGSVQHSTSSQRCRSFRGRRVQKPNRFLGPF